MDCNETMVNSVFNDLINNASFIVFVVIAILVIIGWWLSLVLKNLSR